jgi:hypothetical protein
MSNSRTGLWVAALLIAGCGAAPETTSAERGVAETQAAPPSGPGACAILPTDVWRELLGRPYYGPEESSSMSGNSTISTCRYNDAELRLWRPAPVSTGDAMADRLKQILESTAEADRVNDMNWSVQMERPTGLGVPAALGTVSDGPVSIFRLHALAPDGTMVAVQSADSAGSASKLARRVLERIGK